MDTTAEVRRTGSQTADFVSQYMHQLILCIRAAIGEPVLEMIPNAFVGIQFRGIGWKGHQLKAARTKQEFLDRKRYSLSEL